MSVTKRCSKTEPTVEAAMPESPSSMAMVQELTTSAPQHHHRRCNRSSSNTSPSTLSRATQLKLVPFPLARPTWALGICCCSSSPRRPWLKLNWPLRVRLQHLPLPLLRNLSHLFIPVLTVKSSGVTAAQELRTVRLELRAVRQTREEELEYHKVSQRSLHATARSARFTPAHAVS